MCTKATHVCRYELQVPENVHMHMHKTAEPGILMTHCYSVFINDQRHQRLVCPFMLTKEVSNEAFCAAHASVDAAME